MNLGVSNDILIAAFEKEIRNSRDEHFKTKRQYKFKPLLNPLSSMRECSIDELMKFNVINTNDTYIRLKIASLLQIKSDRY